MRIAIVGTRGIPNNYGGFETLAESLVRELSKQFEFTVYCSSKNLKTNRREFGGAKLEYIDISSHGAAGILYDSIALSKATKSHEKVLLLGFGAGFAVPLLKKHRHKLIVNVGGQDWKRAKWSKPTQRLIKLAERNLVKYASNVISDNLGISQYFMEEYARESIMIEYGGDQARKMPITSEVVKAYPFLLSPYAFSVARIQPDNNIEMMLKAFSSLGDIPFVIVGNWQESKYGRKLLQEYSKRKNLVLHPAIYDRDMLDVLRSNCRFYVHGHSAGGTNPALVEAMFLELPIFAFSSGFNELTTEGKAIYFHTEFDLAEKVRNFQISALGKVGESLGKIARVRYRWELIASKYRDVFLG